jgi:hypothetical protein
MVTYPPPRAEREFRRVSDVHDKWNKRRRSGDVIYESTVALVPFGRRRLTLPMLAEVGCGSAVAVLGLVFLCAAHRKRSTLWRYAITCPHAQFVGGASP